MANDRWCDLKTADEIESWVRGSMAYELETIDSEMLQNAR